MKRRKTQAVHATGQSLLEFALILPLVLLVIIAIFDLGWAVYSYNVISNAAREGARVGLVRQNADAVIRTRVKNAAPGLGLTDQQIMITPTYSVRSDISYAGNPLTVTVTYTYTPMTPVIGQIVAGNGLPLQTTSSMNMEGVIPYSP